MKKVSQLLQETRLLKGYSIEKVFEETKIQPKIIVLLEEGSWEGLPDETYIKGLIKNYGEFLGLERTNLFALFRREYQKKTDLGKPLWPKFPFAFSLSPNFLLILGTVSLLLIMAAYLAFQYFSQALGPKLEVITPQNGLILEVNEVEIRGRTDPDSQVFVNGGKVEISKEGDFLSRLVVSQKVMTIEIVAQNKFGKEKRVQRTIQAR